MSSEKRYYWLKLKEDFFEDDTIQWLEEQENGTEYTLFYLKLCLKSLKNDGKLVRFVGDYLIPYDKKALGKLTDTDSDTVAIAMELFEKIGLIDIFETGEIYLKQIDEMVGSETDAAIRKRRSRAKIEAEQQSRIEHQEDGGKSVKGQSRDNVTRMSRNVTQSKSKSESLDIEKEQEEEKEQKNTSCNSDTVQNKDVHQFYQQNLGMQTPFIIQDLEMWIQDLSAEVVMLALQKTVEKGAAYSYAKGIMKNWANKSIKTIEQANAESLSHSKQRSFNKSPITNKKETLPDWANGNQPSEEDRPLSEEEQALFKERLEKIRNFRKEEEA